MTATAAARNHVGYTESPRGSNCNKFSKRLGRPCQPWCADFITCMFLDIGVDLRKFCDNTSYTPELYGDLKALGWAVDKRNAQGGDIVFFDFPDRVRRIQHVGIAESVSYPSFRTIEGNTGTGNDSNGGEVMDRTRTASLVAGVIRVPLGNKAAPAANTLSDLRNAIEFARGFTIDANGIPTPSVSAAQLAPVLRLLQVGLSRWVDRMSAMGGTPNPPDLPVTGRWDADTKWNVLNLQRILGIDRLENGGVGPLTWKALYP